MAILSAKPISTHLDSDQVLIKYQKSEMRKAIRAKITRFVDEHMEEILLAMLERARGVSVIDADSGKIFTLPPDPKAAALLLDHGIGRLPSALDLNDDVNPTRIIVTSYGHTDPLRMVAGETSITDPTQPIQIQGGSLAPESPQDDLGDQRTLEVGSDSTGDVLVRSTALEPSEEDRMAGSGNVSEVLSAFSLGQTEQQRFDANLS